MTSYFWSNHCFIPNSSVSSTGSTVVSLKEQLSGWPWALHPVFAWEPLQEALPNLSWFIFPHCNPVTRLKRAEDMPAPCPWQTKHYLEPHYFASSPSLLPGIFSAVLGTTCWITLTLSWRVFSPLLRACSIPISGVYPWSLPGVVVDKKHSAVVVPGFLPARGQRQLRALSPLSAAEPRHSVGMVSPLPCFFLSPRKVAPLHCITTTRLDALVRQKKRLVGVTFPLSFVRWRYIHFSG